MSQITPLQQLDQFMGGALQERVSRAISDVTGNIYDLNTDASVTRKVVIELIIKPSKSRREAAVTANVKTKLAPLSALETTAQIGMDSSTKELVMVEQSEIPDGQINMNGEVHENNVARFPTILPKAQQED